ncbi:hypothetical protein I317_04504 [Kwoniella heveanensis CBS 569]|uniref:Transcription activator of gluconeogenesis ERT1 n=1 Tax=Kwoniella heveanensis BCC8398 TaxID=1296120 RepID=A0A1B9H293_9TREE|nr:hypothetical protein I316_00510 [Kwoniella heveanensis BCC8398]OCF41698.1 hypothetical protein I317_04504 [Kwoniella heveanensis CBS 569]
MSGPAEDEHLTAIAKMQERQMSWGRPTRSNSSGSVSSTGESTATSPHLLNLTALAPHQAGGSTSANGGSTSASLAGGSGRGRPKGKGKAKVEKDGEHKARKKVAKACLACQKSHLTCDEQRPCTRCVKKGMADQCVEGVRKKAKYLLEGEERLAAQPRRASTSPPVEPQLGFLTNVSLPAAHQPSITEPPQLVADDVWLSGPLQTNDALSGTTVLPDAGPLWNPPSNGGELASTSLPYQGTAANSEYRMLDSLFGNISPIFQNIDPLDEAGRQMSIDGSAITNASTIGSNTPFDQSWMNPSPSAGSNFTPQTQFGVQPTPGSAGHGPSVSPGTYPDLSPNNPTQSWSGWASDAGQVMLDGSGQPQMTIEQNHNQSSNRLLPSQLRRVGKGLTSAEVYQTVVRPYDYTQGYHILMDYLSKNFEQGDILRVVRSLASFRPSLIALQMPMSEEDEVFLERSFQRTLIELEKLISYSATPTAVWRRTGEVCYANPEFCKLVDRTEADLLVNKTYVYELFSKPSVITYWENFSVHAFENTTQNFFQRVGFTKGPNVLNCTACCTIRRDFFDLPSVIIGQFLPIPPDMS